MKRYTVKYNLLGTNDILLYQTPGRTPPGEAMHRLVKDYIKNPPKEVPLSEDAIKKIRNLINS